MCQVDNKTSQHFGLASNSEICLLKLLGLKGCAKGFLKVTEELKVHVRVAKMKQYNPLEGNREMKVT